MIYLLCRNVGGDVYESGNWDLARAEAERLVGGMIYLHEAKAEPSYFGGRVESVRFVETDKAHGERAVFRLAFAKEARGRKWRGAGHSMAWTGGIVED